MKVRWQLWLWLMTAGLCLVKGSRFEPAGEEVERIPWFDDSSYDEAWQGEIQQAKRDRTKKLPMTSERFRQLFCIKPHRSCQSNPEGCCQDYTCRCNLFGTNCRCRPLGLFARFGRG